MDQLCEALFSCFCQNCDCISDGLDQICGDSWDNCPGFECLSHCCCDFLSVGMDVDCGGQCGLDCCARLCEAMTGGDKNSIANAECDCDSCLDVFAADLSWDCILEEGCEILFENFVCIAVCYACENPITNFCCQCGRRREHKQCTCCCWRATLRKKTFHHEIIEDDYLGVEDLGEDARFNNEMNQNITLNDSILNDNSHVEIEMIPYNGYEIMDNNFDNPEP